MADEITTSVPQPTFGPTGYIILPAESAILTGVFADINAAFGGNLNPGLTTPQWANSPNPKPPSSGT